MSLVAPALLRAELPYRDPSWIYELLRYRAEFAAGAPDLVGNDGEDTLLQRDDPLITLALARYSRSWRMVVGLFGRGGDVRTAALSNRAWYVSRMMNCLPRMFFESDARCAGWLETAPEIDVLALFENPTLDDETAERILLAAPPFDRVPERQRVRAVWGLSRNPAFAAKDPPAIRDIGSKCRDALWKLATIVEPTNEWAMALAQVYPHLSDGSAAATGNPMRAAIRWENGDANEYRAEVQKQLERLAAVLQKRTFRLGT